MIYKWFMLIFLVINVWIIKNFGSKKKKIRYFENIIKMLQMEINLQRKKKKNQKVIKQHINNQNNQYKFRPILNLLISILDNQFKFLNPNLNKRKNNKSLCNLNQFNNSLFIKNLFSKKNHNRISKVYWINKSQIKVRDSFNHLSLNNLSLFLQCNNLLNLLQM